MITISVNKLCDYSTAELVNIDNNTKCFLSSKSAYWNDFWSCDTEDWSGGAENLVFITGMNYI